MLASHRSDRPRDVERGLNHRRRVGLLRRRHRCGGRRGGRRRGRAALRRRTPRSRIVVLVRGRWRHACGGSGREGPHRTRPHHHAGVTAAASGRLRHGLSAAAVRTGHVGVDRHHPAASTVTMGRRAVPKGRLIIASAAFTTALAAVGAVPAPAAPVVIVVVRFPAPGVAVNAGAVQRAVAASPAAAAAHRRRKTADNQDPSQGAHSADSSLRGSHRTDLSFRA